MQSSLDRAPVSGEGLGDAIVFHTYSLLHHFMGRMNFLSWQLRVAEVPSRTGECALFTRPFTALTHRIELDL